jgi:hypothetical protein
MKINRHNYEEFFLLYVDNELSAAGKKAVDVFVKENPDLRAELLALQQTIITPENIGLDKKDWLYVQEDITALQEDLLLYADDELMPADKNSVEFLLATDKAAQAEWSVLQQTKLQPDMAVVFADKRSLYRKETGRVVGFRWGRVAAAAIFVGLALWTGVTVYQNNNKTTTGSGELATDTKTGKEQIKTVVPGNTATVTTQPGENSATENITSTSTQQNNEGNIIESIGPGVEKRIDQNIVDPKENTSVQNTTVQNNNKTPDNNLPKPALQNFNRIESNETKVVAVLNENNSKRVSGNNDAVVKTNPKESPVNANNNTNTDPDNNVTALQVVNNKTSEEEDNNRYLNVDDDKGKRTALGGFLRKAKRVLERTANVKTGEGVKIAGFEIALK